MTERERRMSNISEEIHKLDTNPDHRPDVPSGVERAAHRAELVRVLEETSRHK